MQIDNVPATTRMRLAARMSFSMGIQFVLAGETPADLTDHTLEFTMKQKPHRGGATVLTSSLTITEATEGWCRLNLQAAELDLDAREYDAALVLTTEDGYSALVWAPEVEIVESAAGAAAGTYTGIGSPLTAQMTLMRNNRLTLKLNHLPAPEIHIGLVRTIPYWEEARAEFVGQWPKQFLNLDIPGPGNLNTATAPSLSNIPPGSVLGIVWDGVFWRYDGQTVMARPTSREDVVLMFIDQIGGGEKPEWALDTDIYVSST